MTHPKTRMVKHLLFEDFFFQKAKEEKRHKRRLLPSIPTGHSSDVTLRWPQAPPTQSPLKQGPFFCPTFARLTSPKESSTLYKARVKVAELCVSGPIQQRRSVLLGARFLWSEKTLLSFGMVSSRPLGVNAHKRLQAMLESHFYQANKNQGCIVCLLIDYKGGWNFELSIGLG